MILADARSVQADKDEKISTGEFQQYVAAQGLSIDIEEADLDGDGFIDKTEWEKLHEEEEEVRNPTNPLGLIIHWLFLIIVVIIICALWSQFKMQKQTLGSTFTVNTDCPLVIRMYPGSTNQFGVIGAYEEDSTPSTFFPNANTWSFSSDVLTVTKAKKGSHKSPVIIDIYMGSTLPSMAFYGSKVSVSLDALESELDFSSSGTITIDAKEGLFLADKAVAGSANIAFNSTGGVQINTYEVTAGTFLVGAGDVYLASTDALEYTYSQPHGLVCMSAPSTNSISQSCQSTAEVNTTMLTDVGCSGVAILGTTTTAQNTYTYKADVTAAYGNVYGTVTSSTINGTVSARRTHRGMDGACTHRTRTCSQISLTDTLLCVSSPQTSGTRGFDNGTVNFAPTSIVELELGRTFIDEDQTQAPRPPCNMPRQLSLSCVHIAEQTSVCHHTHPATALASPL